jgi:hypothetical protein
MRHRRRRAPIQTATFRSEEHPMIRHIPVQIDSHDFIVTVVDDRAHGAARVHFADRYELIWLNPERPSVDVMDILDAAGFSTEKPHKRVSNV